MPSDKATTSSAKKSIKKTPSGKASRKRTLYKEQGLAKSNTRKLAYKAGVKSLSSNVYGQVSDHVHDRLTKLLTLCVIDSNNKKRTTITEESVRASIQRLGSVSA